MQPPKRTIDEAAAEPDTAVGQDAPLLLPAAAYEVPVAHLAQPTTSLGTLLVGLLCGIIIGMQIERCRRRRKMLAPHMGCAADQSVPASGSPLTGRAAATHGATGRTTPARRWPLDGLAQWLGAFRRASPLASALAPNKTKGTGDAAPGGVDAGATGQPTLNELRRRQGAALSVPGGSAFGPSSSCAHHEGDNDAAGAFGGFSPASGTPSTPFSEELASRSVRANQPPPITLSPQDVAMLESFGGGGSSAASARRVSGDSVRPSSLVRPPPPPPARQQPPSGKGAAAIEMRTCGAGPKPIMQAHAPAKSSARSDALGALWHETKPVRPLVAAERPFVPHPNATLREMAKGTRQAQAAKDLEVGIATLGRPQVASSEHTNECQQQTDRLYQEREARRQSVSDAERRAREEADAAAEALIAKYRLPRARRGEREAHATAPAP